MSNIINLIKLDYYTQKAYIRARVLIIAFIAMFVVILNRNPPLIMYVISLAVANSMGTTFSIYEKNKLNMLYGILPIRKQQIVIGRYLFTLAFGLLNEVIGAVLTLIVAYALNINVSNFTFIAYLCGSFLLFCLFISVQFPLYFKYEFSNIIAVAILPLLLSFIVVMTLIKKHAELFSQVIKFFIHNPNMIWLIGIGAGLIILSISCLLSCVIYKHREL